MRERRGDLIKLAKEGHFDLIAHGCNCFCTMGSGIAKQIKEELYCAYEADLETERGDINKLGNYTFATYPVGELTPDATGYTFDDRNRFIIVNLYSQFTYNRKTRPIDYEALTLGLRKINYRWAGKTIGLPLIGAGLAGGDWNRIKKIIETELNAMDVWIVHYDG